MTKETKPTNLTRRALLGRAAAAGSLAVIGGGFIAAPNASWALTVNVISSHQMATFFKWREIFILTIRLVTSIMSSRSKVMTVTGQRYDRRGRCSVGCIRESSWLRGLSKRRLGIRSRQAFNSYGRYGIFSNHSRGSGNRIVQPKSSLANFWLRRRVLF